MKVRQGFVSNSSASSFVLLLVPEEIHDKVMERASDEVHAVVGDLQSQGYFKQI